MSYQSRIEALRARMAQAGVDAVIIPQADPHMSEYISSRWQTRRWFSGFTGSAGDLVVTATEALLWTDSRYFLQAGEQLAPSGITLMRDGLPDTPSIGAWLCSHLKAGQTVALDGFLYSVSAEAELRRMLPEHGIALRTDYDPVDAGEWADRPELPDAPVEVHDVAYAGLEAGAKIEMMREAAASHGAGALLFSALDDVAWILNIRSRDVRYSPVTISYLYIGADRAILFVTMSKLSKGVIDYLAGQGVDVAAYDSLPDFLRTLPQDERVAVDRNRTTAAVAAILGSRAVLLDLSPAALPKARKNATQVAGIRNAMLRDGAAMVRSLREIEMRVASGEPTTELDVAEILRRHRGASPLFVEESFGTIAGYGPHGAIVHYEATQASSSALKPEGLLLIDSGAQYYDGTTDITRTISLSATPTAQERRDFTLVMKGHIALGTAIYPEGTRGAQLDALARQFLWKDGLSYLHGTGHGVGHYLGVHEGPQSIRLNWVDIPLQPGMLISNEPGLYREGLHGIRCENLVLVTEAMTTEFGKFYSFETVTLCPFDLRLFDTEIMTPEEIAWVNAYHGRVRRELSPLLDEAERAWLEEKTQDLK